jgi:F-type H+-transporting ATPase subunit b
VVQSVTIFGVLGADEPTEAQSNTTEGHNSGVADEGGTVAGEGLNEHTAETAQPDNPVLPTVNELAWSAAMFVLLWALLKFWLLKPIQRTMAQRAEKIRGDVEAAEAARTQASGALTEYEASLASARVEASRIIDEARTQADEERKRLMAAAEAEVAELRAAANAEVSAAKSEALTSMRSDVTTIAVQAAEIVVQKRLDAGAQRAIVDEFLNRSSQN